jgi:hypothetical protein
MTLLGVMEETMSILTSEEVGSSLAPRPKHYAQA